MALWRSTAVRSLLGYLAVFAILAHGWWSTAAYALPPGCDPRDSRLIVWTLAWVTRALAHAPTSLTDPPIYFPAPARLTGSEHYLSLQLVFAPAYWATGNAVLAANVAALISYPASAFAMERLLAAQRLSPGASWFGGLMFALGALRTTASMEVLQFLTLFLPLVALRIQRLREHPGARELVLLSACLLLAMFSSYYLALLVVLTTAIWGAFELARSETHRPRVGALIGVAALCSGGILVAASRPYVQRLRALPGGATPAADEFWRGLPWTLLALEARDPIWLMTVALAVCGAVASLRARGSRRALTAVAVAFVVAGLVLLAFGWPWPLAPWFKFFRERSRYLLLSSLGFSILASQGFDAIRARIPHRIAGTILLGILGGAFVWARLGSLAPRADVVLATSRDLENYRRIGVLASQQKTIGPILEIPYVSNQLVDRGPEQMMGQTVHDMPLINGYAGYPPDHLPMLEQPIGALPSKEAMDDLVDMTHLRWIIVRPAEEWPSASSRRRFLAGLSRSPPGPSWLIGTWILQRLDRVPEHREWFDALAAGPRSGHSVLGTSLAPIPEVDASAKVSARVTPGGLSGGFVEVEATAHNRGRVAWPTWAAGGSPTPGLVRWEVRWRPADGSSAEWGPATELPLRRDVPPNETLTQTLVLRLPAEPGPHLLRIALTQQDGARFSSPGNEVAILRLDVARGTADATQSIFR